MAKTFRTGLLTGVAATCAIFAVAALLVWPPTALGRVGAAPEPPVLPPLVAGSTESGNLPYGSLKEGIVQSYWIPFLTLVRDEYPDATIHTHYRHEELIPGGVFRLSGNDPADAVTLIDMLDESAEERGWTAVEAYQFESSIYTMRGYEQDGYVFAVLAFTNAIQEAASNSLVIDLDFIGTPPADGPRVQPLFVLTNLPREGLPWLAPDWKPIERVE